MAAIVFDQVTKRFGDTVAVDAFSLEVTDGEFLVLVGPSGCGKSTTLRMLAGLDEISGGTIRIGDRVVNDVPAKDRDIAMVFQTYALYPHMTVLENMTFALRMRKIPRDEAARRAHEAAQLLGIEPLLNRKPGQLSGGQRQRVALGRAIVREPAVFLLDEPLSNLDAKLRVQTRSEISKLHQRLGTTFVYVTHDQVEAMTMADRIAVMQDGRLQQVGAPQNLYDTPANVFVAGFIGSPSMNFFEASVRVEGEQAILDAGDARIVVTPEQARALQPHLGQRVILGIRPEHLHDPAYQPSGVVGAPLEASVDLVEQMGSEAFVHLQQGDLRLLARFDPRTQARAGEAVPVLLDLQHLHAFDATTERAIELPRRGLSPPAAL